MLYVLLTAWFSLTGLSKVFLKFHYLEIWIAIGRVSLTLEAPVQRALESGRASLGDWNLGIDLILAKGDVRRIA